MEISIGKTYPTDNDINTLDGRAGFTQKYEAMRDLIFTVNGNYAHTNLDPAYKIPSKHLPPHRQRPCLPNGNTVLPNGTILSPTGQAVGQVSRRIWQQRSITGEPFQSIHRHIYSRQDIQPGVFSLSGSVNRTEFENQSLQPNFNSRTLTESAAVLAWPLFYAYSNGSVSTISRRCNNRLAASVIFVTPSASTTLISGHRRTGHSPVRAVCGSVYFGHQGSEGDGATAGGDVYGGALSYYSDSRQ